MAKINFNDYKQYTNNAPEVFEVKQFAQSGYTFKDFRSLGKFLQSNFRGNPSISFILVYSTTESTGTCYSERVHTGNSGRPKERIIGKKIAPHIHILLINLSNEISIKGAEHVVEEHLRELHHKKPYIKRHTGKEFDDKKTPSLHAGNYYKYLNRQADHKCFGGAEHNWKYYESEMWHN